MKALLCWFSLCKWRHVLNVDDSREPMLDTVGVYQCTRCKSISIGSPR